MSTHRLVVGAIKNKQTKSWNHPESTLLWSVGWARELLAPAVRIIWSERLALSVMVQAMGNFPFFLSLLSGGVVDWMFVLGLPADRVSVFLVFSRCTNFYFLITVAVITSLCTQNLCDREPFDSLNNICSGKMMKKCTSSNFQLQNFKF